MILHILHLLWGIFGFSYSIVNFEKKPLTYINLILCGYLIVSAMQFFIGF